MLAKHLASENKRKILQLITIFAALFVSACGGGGDGGGPVASSLSFPFAQAIANFSASDHAYTVKVSGQGNGMTASGSGTLVMSAASGATFEGQAALKQVLDVAVNVTLGGSTVPVAFSGFYYYSTNYNPVGSSLDDGTAYCIAQGIQTYPASVNVGDAAILGTYDCYSDDTKSVQDGTDVESYAVEADTATSALVNLVTDSYSLANDHESTTEMRYRINEAGMVSLVSVTNTDRTVSPARVMILTVQ